MAQQMQKQMEMTVTLMRSIPERMIDLRHDVFIIGDGDDLSFSFDLEGRWYSAHCGEWYYRRGFSGRIVKMLRAMKGRPPSEPVILDKNESEELTQSVQSHARAALDQWIRGARPALNSGTEPQDIREILEKILSWTPERYHFHSEQYHRIYGAIPILPPDQYLALYLQPVVGCRYNHCTFCTLYAGHHHFVRSAVAWREHCEEVLRFFGRGISLRHGIFLGDANVLELDPEELADRIEVMRSLIPDADHPASQDIFAFQDAFGPRIPRHPEFYASLVKAGLKRVYVGVETGSDTVRRLVAKPGRAVDVAENVRVMKQAGLSVGVMLIIGMGGRKHENSHTEETIRAVAGMRLDRSDRIFLSPLAIDPHSAYARQTGEFTPLASAELAAQEALFRKKLSAGVPMMKYRVEGFVY